MSQMILSNINRHAQVLNSLMHDEDCILAFDQIKSACLDSLKQQGKILFCGNGGSAADSQHLAAELTGRYLLDRQALAAVALGSNLSHTTAISNDYQFNQIFSREVEAIGKAGDILIALSTSGNSENVSQALIKAKEMGIMTLALTGATGGKLKLHADVCLCVPSTETARIQEMHMLIGHALCETIEVELFSNP